MTRMIRRWRVQPIPMSVLWAALASLAVGAILALSAAFAEARLVRFEVVQVESPTFEGQEFGNVGPYEKVIARATLEVDPAGPHNAGIVDLALAPTNAAGHVEFVADVTILKPVDLARGNGRLFYDVLNRGNKIGLILLNDAPGGNNPTSAVDAGNGFLMREGYTVVWSAWQGDVPAGGGRMLLSVPVLAGLTGTNRDEFIFDNTTNPVEADLSYPAADLNPALATLTLRQREADPRQTPAGLSFTYLSPTRIRITRPAGFDAGAIYEFIYPARDSKVMGLGFAATRDIVSFLRNEAADAAGNPNPLSPGGTPAVRHALALGISQSGRFLRDFLYQGFNEDEDSRMVFDGLIPHIAGSRKTFTNFRFAQPGRFSRQHEDHLFPGDQFPFTYAVLTDALTGQTDGILGRCLAANNCPKIIHTDTATEFWQARSSLVVTSTAGAHLELPPNVRAYLMSSAPHFNQINAVAAPTATCQQLSNPLHVGAAMRALVRALDRWVSHGTRPPASRFPTRKAGTLVPSDQASVGFPAIPGVTYDGVLNGVRVVDHTVQPPAEGAAYPVFVARVDPDGHDVAGIRLPAVQAPVATLLGWNLRRAGFAEGELCGLTGSAIPLRETRAERLAAGDPRKSLEERFEDHEGYVEAVKKAAEALRKQGFLLKEDEKRIIREAAQSDVLGKAERDDDEGDED